MQEMSVEMATLLKSKKMIGENKPSKRVLLSDSTITGEADFSFPHTEANQIGSLAYHNNLLYVSQVITSGIFIYSMNGEYVSSINSGNNNWNGMDFDDDYSDGNILWTTDSYVYRFDLNDSTTYTLRSNDLDANGVAAPKGEYIWVGVTSGKLLKVKKSDLSVVKEFPWSYSVSDVAWDGLNLYVSGLSDKIQIFDPVTEKIVYEIKGPSSELTALTFDGSYLWTGDNRNNAIARFPRSIISASGIKSITINRNKGMAGGLTLEFDNKNAILAPDGTANPRLLWPNKEVIVKQGYGAESITTFTGLIDSISMSTFPQSVTVSARDKMKPLLDHYIRNADFLYTLTYTNMTVEHIWENLMILAGVEYDIIEETGLTISEKTFNWETYGDAISWLDEISGFQTYCDEVGKMNFVRDGRPVDTTPAYSFVEGVDIISLSYDIDDKDLYYSVAVYGRQPAVYEELTEQEIEDGVKPEVISEEMVIYFARQFPQAEYWNIPSGKVMRIDAPDADTQAKCEQIADKAIYLMETRARKVQFKSIGIPHLQIGDFIQVTESSTTISEIYRITDISTTQADSSYTMNLSCYYHAAPEVI